LVLHSMDGFDTVKGVADWFSRDVL
jgi:hypothetical protein